ncbi:protein kinase domain-containing protein [Butyrivibrio sp. VCB2001]|uniref:protein kinase domain-containing protein n=1 Tax=Butyrivibrio sp. VCB2001 TaxID=1280667 RepID=UPI0004062AAD|nr:hypothetical protein [Butyrivibrio sp. VCB2001]
MPYKRKVDSKEKRQLFTDNKGNSFMAPLYVGEERYELYDILSAAGGFGIIYKAKDRRIGNHEVLIKARRYDNEPGLFSFQGDVSRATKIEKIREKTLFEAECLKMFKEKKESRMPILNDIVWGFSPSIYGPHKDMEGNDYYIDDDYVYEEPYIVMQVINGINLGEITGQSMSLMVPNKGYKCYYEWEQQVLEYIKEICTIFSSFHNIRTSEGNSYYYIYQDLKPDNIIVSNERFVTLLDFGGITKIKVHLKHNEIGQMQEVTETGMGSPGLGTFGFQAPEARNSALIKALDRRCDIYTIGATMYQLLTGFDFADILADEDSEIPLEESLKGIVSDATYEVLRKCLQRDREKRYSNVQDLRTDIITKCFADVKSHIRNYYA